MASSSRSRAAPLSDIELTTTLLITHLGLEDIRDIHWLAAEASYLDDEPFSSEEYALRLQAQYLEDMLQVVEDHRLAVTLSEGLEANHPAFRDLVRSQPINSPPDIRPTEITPFFLDEDELDGEYVNPEVHYILNANSPLSLSGIEVLDEDDIEDMYAPHRGDYYG
jgi:hypothetical protein